METSDFLIQWIYVGGTTAIIPLLIYAIFDMYKQRKLKDAV